MPVRYAAGLLLSYMWSPLGSKTESDLSTPQLQHASCNATATVSSQTVTTTHQQELEQRQDTSYIDDIKYRCLFTVRAYAHFAAKFIPSPVITGLETVESLLPKDIGRLVRYVLFDDMYHLRRQTISFGLPKELHLHIEHLPSPPRKYQDANVNVEDEGSSGTLDRGVVLLQENHEVASPHDVLLAEEEDYEVQVMDERQRQDSAISLDDGKEDILSPVSSALCDLVYEQDTTANGSGDLPTLESFPDLILVAPVQEVPRFYSRMSPSPEPPHFLTCFGGGTLSEQEFVDVTLRLGFNQHFNSTLFKRILEHTASSDSDEHGTCSTCSSDDLNAQISAEAFHTFWIWFTSIHGTSDPETLSFHLLAPTHTCYPKSAALSYLVPSDLAPLLTSLLQHHPAYTFLRSSAFLDHYRTYVTTRLFYEKSNPFNGRMSLREWKKLNVIGQIARIEQVEDCLGVEMWQSSESDNDGQSESRRRVDISGWCYKDFYVAYCRFWEGCMRNPQRAADAMLENQLDMLLDDSDLLKTLGMGLTPVVALDGRRGSIDATDSHRGAGAWAFICERAMEIFGTRVIVSEVVVKDSASEGSDTGVDADTLHLQPTTNETEHSERKMFTFGDFVLFLLAVHNRSHPTSLAYWFHLLDLDGDGMLSLHELETVYTHCLAAQMVDPARLASADEHATADIYDIPDEFYCPSDFLCLVHDVLRLSPGKHFVTLRDWKRDPEATLTVLRLMLGESNSGELLCYIEKSPNAPCSEDDTESSEHEDGESGFFIKGWKAWIEGEYRTLVGDGAESECDDVSDSCDGYEQECVHKN